MSKNKKYYWLKLKEDFFDDKYTKMLRRTEDGSDMIIVYLKLQLKSLKTDGYIKFDKLLPTCEEELAVIIDEPVSIVAKTINMLIKMNLIEKLDGEDIYMLAMQDFVGKEGESAQRVRDFRARQETLQCNGIVTQKVTQKVTKK